MPAAALFAVLAAALLHASWNLVVKSSSERLVAAAAQIVLAALVSLPFLVWRGFPTAALGFLLASALVQTGYVYSLAAAYDRADLSFVYPLARGTAPVLIALGGLIGLSVAINGRGWLALALICGGVIALALTATSHSGVGWSLLTGVLIATYINIDGAGVARTPDTFAYTAALHAFTGVLLVPLVITLRGAGLDSACRPQGVEASSRGRRRLPPLLRIAALRLPAGSAIAGGGCPRDRSGVCDSRGMVVAR